MSTQGQSFCHVQDDGDSHQGKQDEDDILDYLSSNMASSGELQAEQPYHQRYNVHETKRYKHCVVEINPLMLSTLNK